MRPYSFCGQRKHLEELGASKGSEYFNVQFGIWVLMRKVAPEAYFVAQNQIYESVPEIGKGATRVPGEVVNKIDKFADSIKHPLILGISVSQSLMNNMGRLGCR
jgi:hypothetical protein